MKKFIYAGALLAVVGIGTLVACSKENTTKNPSPKTEANILKNGGTRTILTDAQLIAAIKGEMPDYLNLSDLEDLLYGNSKLSDNVISTLIEISRVPDFIVETALVLSAPVSSTELSHLSSQRPALKHTAIIAAADAKDDANYVVINTNPRQVLFGRGMVKSSSCEDCGEGTITTQSDNLLINLTSTTTPLEPAEMKPCKSSNTSWVCGTAKLVHLNSTDGTNANYSVTCQQSTDKCIQNVQSARHSGH